MTFELVEYFDVSLHSKINFITHFFLEILHFKESCSLIEQEHFGPQLENQNFTTGVKYQ